MLKRELLLPPEYIYPVDPWRWIENQFDRRFLAQSETLFAVSNGYLGMRGCFEEGAPVFHTGTFINGFHESWPLYYPEAAYGFAKTGQGIINVTDSRIIRLYVDDEPFYLPTAQLLSYTRVLDMRAGMLERQVVWETHSGARVRIESRRIVSLVERHVAAFSYRVIVENARKPVVIASDLVAYPRNEPGTTEDGAHQDDPRTAGGFRYQVLMPETHQAQGERVLLGHRTKNSGMTIVCGADHRLVTDCDHQVRCEASDFSGRVVYSIMAEPGAPITLTKFAAYHTSRRVPVSELAERAERTLDRTVVRGIESLVSSQREFLDDFWERSDVEIRSNLERAQQTIRWNLFQILQATGRAEGAGVPAKGLTGQGYEGHYFWDVEIYVLPFLIYTEPRIARNLLRFRHSMLDHARQRARDVNQRGALFPWRTINGEESSAYYAAGTAQYHINADIVYALKKYVEMTGDTELLYNEGAEILVETARMWADLGFYSDRKGGHFCIHGVTGPDEYNTVVDNNTYTNLMARENLRFAAESVAHLEAEQPDWFAALVDRTGLRPEEPQEWKRAADAMYIAFDERMGIHLQDDGFLDRKLWDFDAVPAERYPLLLYYHPLVIYRHQVVKQPDVVMAMFLLGSLFSAEQKRLNFEYYDPLTTGDSSLAACIQSIVACEVGDREKAAEYYRYASLMDLADVGGNVRDGAHIASMGGTWMAVVYGLAGMRDYGGELSFDPTLAQGIDGVRFRITVRGQLLEVDIASEEATYRLVQGEHLTLRHQGQAITLESGQAVKAKTRPGARRPARKR